MNADRENLTMCDGINGAMLRIAAVVLVGLSISVAQEVAPPPIAEVSQQFPPDAHVLDFVNSSARPLLGTAFAVEIGGKIVPVYKVGGGVTAPRVLRAPSPHYAEEARREKYQGSVILWTVVGPDGVPHNTKVARSLGLGLDEEALSAVRKWRFRPATKDGKPVAVMINVEVNFRLGN